MGKGRFLKAAERACATKARFDTPLDAERTAEWRYRAYLCPVCHGYHLTSGRGAPLTDRDQAKAKPQDPGPTLRDLDWSKARRAVDTPPPPPSPGPDAPKDPPGSESFESSLAPPLRPALITPMAKTARCVTPPGKDHRVRLVVEGALSKSAPIRDPALRSMIKSESIVEVSEGTHPTILRPI